jgi:hypothetical protein
MADDVNRPVMGRPVIEIDYDTFEQLCELQCTLAEIATWFRCSEDTIERRVQEHYNCTFAEIYEQKKGAGKIALRRAQSKAAQSGNPALLIFLGKNILGQKDKTEVDLDLSGDGLQIILGAKPDSV